MKVSKGAICWSQGPERPSSEVKLLCGYCISYEHPIHRQSCRARVARQAEKLRDDMMVPVQQMQGEDAWRKPLARD